MITNEYKGKELDTFSRATFFKKYYLNVSGLKNSHFTSVLEVGAGIGSLYRIFKEGVSHTYWTLVEPDSTFCDQLQMQFSSDEKLVVVNSTLSGYVTNEKFDLIILADVIEHIEDDSAALSYALSLLSNHGQMVIFVPALMSLYSAFDESIGHFRRYNKKTLSEAIPASARIKQIGYIDSVGCLLSLANKMLLKSGSPSAHAIQFWDKIVIPISQVVDRIIGYRIGKNLYCIVFIDQ